MPRGGFGFGSGMGYAQGFGYGRGMGGNWGANCRMYPWMPRRWWANSNFQSNIPMPTETGFPQEEYLKSQAQFLTAQLGEIEKRLDQLDKKADKKNENNV